MLNLQQLNAQLQQALSMLQEQKQTHNLDIGNIDKLLERAVGGISDNNHQGALNDLMAAMGQLNSLAESIMKTSGSPDPIMYGDTKNVEKEDKTKG